MPTLIPSDITVGEYIFTDTATFHGDNMYFTENNYWWRDGTNHTILGKRYTDDPCNACIMFNNITIPQGTYIVNVIVNMYFYTTGIIPGDTKLNLSYSFNDTATPVFPTGTEDYNSKALTSVTTQDEPWTHTEDTPLYSPDLATQVNTLVNKSGWVDGGDMLFFCKDNGSQDNHGASVKGTAHADVAYRPELVITYGV